MAAPKCEGADFGQRDAGGIDPKIEHHGDGLDRENSPKTEEVQPGFHACCVALNRSPELAADVAAIRALGDRVLTALFAEILAGRAPSEAIREYAAISPAAVARAQAALEQKGLPQ